MQKKNSAADQNNNNKMRPCENDDLKNKQNQKINDKVRQRYDILDIDL